ncbi:hypothetical protein H2201_004102 [Coniosporium apollinis]|uniref:PIN domain-containing protein n=2 Tax=Coniosporium TaxID=2810619 RepID=A0ABQ9NWW8_9PEZI|nr:hypothetical protein H2199_006400 [Cladosporium sp. JES 115]KAJ9665794.1 hypothetical protein H2201_004102 [Coniosporium apollinis]
MEADLHQSEALGKAVDAISPKRQSPVSHTLKSEEQQPQHQTSNKQVMQHYTVIVCDTSMLLDQYDVFCKLIEGGTWNVVIPDSVIEELSFICSGDVRDEKHRAAVRALQTLDSAIIQRKNIRVLTAEGKDVTRQITGRGHLNAQVGNDRASIDDVVVGVARQQSGLNKDTAGAVSGPQEGAEAAVLVTDMESMSLKAQASGVRAMASSKLWNILDLGRTRSRAGSGGKSVSS